MTLDIAISGGGICGLSAAVALARHGHKPTVYEASPTIRTVGAGIQVVPNMSRLLYRMGLRELLLKHAVSQESVIHHRWADGDLVGLMRLEEIARLAQSPYVTVHRGQLLDNLYQIANELGVKFIFDAEVLGYDLEKPSMRTVDGHSVKPDLLIVADGIKSSARQHYPQTDLDSRFSSKYAAFRATVPASKISENDKVTWLADPAHQHRWIGPNGHIVAYLIDSNTLLNLVFVLPRSEARIDRDPGDELREMLKGWDPNIRLLLNMIENVTKWPIWVAPQLDSTVSASGRSIIVGDAAHDMTPYLAQGGAMSVEDAALLGKLLADVSHPDGIATALRQHEALRLPRTKQVTLDAIANRELFHLPDGEAQHARDRRAIDNQENPEVESPYQWETKAGRHWLYEFDVEVDDPRSFLASS